VQAYFGRYFDESNTGLPFGCLLTQILIDSGISIASEPKMKIQDPLKKQTECGFLLPDCTATSAGCQLFSDYGGSGSYSGGHEFHAVVYVIHATGHLYHAAGGSLHQPPGVPQVPPPVQ